MQRQNTRAIVVSALLTAIIMTLIGGGFFYYNGWLPVGVAAQRGGEVQPQADPPIVVTVQPYAQPETQQAAPNLAAEAAVAPVTVDQTLDQANISNATADANADVIAAYQAQLEEAYKALEEAYAQIEALQTAQAAQSQIVGRPYYGDDGGESRRYGSDDRGFGFFGEREGGEGYEREYDDD